MDCSTPGFPVLHYLPELAQIHVHWVSDAISPPHPLLPPSPFAFHLSQHQGPSQWVYLYLKERKVKMKSLSHVQLFVTPWTVAYQASPSTGFSRQEYWSGLLFPSSGHLPDPGIKPGSPTLQADALTSELPGKPIYTWNLFIISNKNAVPINNNSPSLSL